MAVTANKPKAVRRSIMFAAFYYAVGVGIHLDMVLAVRLRAKS